MRDKKLTITIIIVLMISVIGLGIAFAAFSQTLTINGTGTVESSSWQVVFEGADGSNTIGAPTLVGTAAEVTHPTIKNNSTEIGDYEVTLKSPGDSVTYNFKIHNKGDYAANLSSLTVAGRNRPAGPLSGSYLIKNYDDEEDYFILLTDINYSFYYTSDNMLVGQIASRDCLEPGESVNVSLKIQFIERNYNQEIIEMFEEYGTQFFSSEDKLLDNLGISATYNQSNNGSCPLEQGVPVVNIPFENIDYSYYTYEGKSFMGTGVNNIIISENITSLSKYASKAATQCSDGSKPKNSRCPEGTTPVFTDHPAEDVAAAYCTGCRLMTNAEAISWCGPLYGTYPKCIAKYNGTDTSWWFSETLLNISNVGPGLGSSGQLYFLGGDVTYNYGVRPVVSIPSTATMTGSGTKLDPYVITVNNN